jgi:hypothetical protein
MPREGRFAVGWPTASRQSGSKGKTSPVLASPPHDRPLAGGLFPWPFAYDFFNRQPAELEIAATHRKQTTAIRFNRQTEAVFLFSPLLIPRGPASRSRACPPTCPPQPWRKRKSCRAWITPDCSPVSNHGLSTRQPFPTRSGCKSMKTNDRLGSYPSTSGGYFAPSFCNQGPRPMLRHPAPPRTAVLQSLRS